MKKTIFLIFTIAILIFSSLAIHEVSAQGVKIVPYSSFSSNLTKDKEGNLSYTVRSGDTLWKIAQNVYGVGLEDLWPRIFNANDISLLSNGYPLIEPGQILSIPGASAEDISKADNDFLTIKSVKEFKNPNEILYPELVLEDMMEEGIFPNDEDYIGISFRASKMIGPYSPGKGLDAPMDAYIENSVEANFSYDPFRCGGLPENIAKSKTITKYHVSECTRSFLSNSYSYKVKDENRQNTNSGFLVIKDGEIVGEYLFADQLVYHPELDELSFRARRDDQWFVVRNGIEDAYDYVEALFYTASGDFYIAAKEGDSWILKRNDKVIERASYIGNFVYVDGGSAVTYRVHKMDEEEDVWFYVIRGIKQAPNNYVDKLSYNSETGEIFYRVKDNKGDWFFVKVDSSNKSQIFYEGILENGELKNIYIHPLDPTHVVGEYKIDGQEVLFSDVDQPVRKYEFVGGVLFSKDGNHFSYVAYQQLGGANTVADFVVDNKHVQRICRGSFSCSLDLPEFLKHSFNKESNSVITYTHQDQMFTRTEYELD